jgi:transcriptional antiterminator
MQCLHPVTIKNPVYTIDGSPEQILDAHFEVYFAWLQKADKHDLQCALTRLRGFTNGCLVQLGEISKQLKNHTSEINSFLTDQTFFT